MRCHAKGHIIAKMQCKWIVHRALWAKIALYSLDLSLGINTFSHLVSVTYSILYWRKKNFLNVLLTYKSFKKLKNSIFLSARGLALFLFHLFSDLLAECSGAELPWDRIWHLLRWKQTPERSDRAHCDIHALSNIFEDKTLHF